jgi:hypothetical protein
MKYTSNEQLMEDIGEGFLWEIVSNYAETHPELLKEAMLAWCGYIDETDIAQITSIEVRESDEFIVNGFTAENGVLTVSYEMPAGILAQNDDGSVCYHVTTWCSGEAEIPDAASFDWDSLDFANMNRLQLLAHKNLAKVVRFVYEETEADNLNA